MPTIGFIGAGNMAEAIARGILRATLFQASEIRATDPSPDRQRVFAEDLGISCTGAPEGAGGAPANAGEAARQTAAGSDIVILAVKPFIVADVLRQMAPGLKAGTLLISIAAGISSGFIERALGGQPRVIRVMPNTPMLVGKGMSALTRGAFATEQDLIAAERIFAAAGKTVRVPESAMDAVTALSGSGPAYIFFLTEALTQGGMSVGLTELQAQQLARETVIGAASLLERSKDSPAELRRKVTTPKGTTQAAIESLEANDFAGLMTRALAAAAQRSKELGK